MIRYFLFSLLLSISFGLFSCGSKSSVSQNEYSNPETENNGNAENWCATIEYYNPNTGTRSTYQEQVDVSNNEVTAIHFGNGGWMANHHFVSGGELSNGETEIESDKGYYYTVHLNSQGDCNTASDGDGNKDESEDEDSPESDN